MEPKSEVECLQEIYSNINDQLVRLQELQKRNASRNVAVAITEIETGTLWIKRHMAILEPAPA